MALFVLVHGSFHGAWCWSRFSPLLRARGHRVLAPNLPASGGDATPLENAGLASYATHIAATIDNEREPVILVGHSMGAIVSSQVTEWRTDRVAAVVYVCGLLLRTGETLVGFLEEHKYLGVEDLVIKNMKVSEDGSVATFPTEVAPEVFYNQCTPENARWAASQLCPQSTSIYGQPLVLTANGFGRARRFYVEALQDRAVSPTYQRVMVERTSCERVFTLDSDHSPFLSQPRELAEVLETVVQIVN